MYINTGQLHNSLLTVKDKSSPLIVSSCGTYRLDSDKSLPTCRPRGRLDYQLIYIASGTARFHFDNAENETLLSAGNMVLYRPKEFQKYEYLASEQSEVYWVHFTGSDVKNILRFYGISDDMQVFSVGCNMEFNMIFQKMISELQHCQPDYKDMVSLLFRSLLITLHRQLTQKETVKNGYLSQTMERASQYFIDNYSKNINIEAYASSIGMSISWFIQNFKDYTGMTPMQYILSIRIENARLLFETTGYTITEIAGIVGYDNPLYFSRLFHKQTGYSPSAYRKRMK